jgi:hypothetical protein
VKESVLLLEYVPPKVVTVMVYFPVAGDTFGEKAVIEVGLFTYTTAEVEAPTNLTTKGLDALL